MAPASGNEMVLNFGSAWLLRSDVEQLEHSEELTDQIIEFFFEYLTAQVNKSMQRTLPPLLLVGPVQTYLLLHCPLDDLHDVIKPMSLPEREMVIFVLNNNPDSTKVEAGFHWSLIVYSRPQNAFEHYDSFAGLNGGVAQRLVDRIKSRMGKESSQAELKDRETPQQQNEYDCGVYVMKITQLLCNAFTQQQRAVTFTDIENPLQTEVTPASVEEMRASTVKLIRELAKQSSLRD